MPRPSTAAACSGKANAGTAEPSSSGPSTPPSMIATTGLVASERCLVDVVRGRVDIVGDRGCMDHEDAVDAVVVERGSDRRL